MQLSLARVCEVQMAFNRCMERAPAMEYAAVVALKGVGLTLLEAGCDQRTRLPARWRRGWWRRVADQTAGVRCQCGATPGHHPAAYAGRVLLTVRARITLSVLSGQHRGEPQALLPHIVVGTARACSTQGPHRQASHLCCCARDMMAT